MVNLQSGEEKILDEFALSQIMQDEKTRVAVEPANAELYI